MPCPPRHCGKKLKWALTPETLDCSSFEALEGIAAVLFLHGFSGHGPRSKPQTGNPLTTEGDEVAVAFYRISLFSGEADVSSYFRYLKNHPFEAVERNPKPTRRMTVIRTPAANIIMLPPWS
jgi:hypothetical protein